MGLAGPGTGNDLIRLTGLGPKVLVKAPYLAVTLFEPTARARIP